MRPDVDQDDVPSRTPGPVTGAVEDKPSNVKKIAWAVAAAVIAFTVYSLYH